REQHVVDDEDALAVDVEIDPRPLDDRVLHAPVEVVAVERDVDDAERHGLAAIDLAQDAAEPLRDVHAARPDADERQIAGAVAALDHFVRDADDGAPDRLRVHDESRAIRGHDGTRVKKTPPRPGREASRDARVSAEFIVTLPDLAGSS